jgi:nucleoside-diphosphate-sugar epimerase
MGKLAVTGITGKSGMYFLKEILNQENAVFERWRDIKCSTRNLANVEKVRKMTSGTSFNFVFLEGNLTDQRFCEKICFECDTVLHIAGIHWSRELVSAAVKQGVKRLILVHTTGIYSKYKAAGEEYRETDKIVYQLCKENAIDVTILRPTMIYGSLHDHNISVFIRMVDRCKVMPTVNGAHYELQPVHCRDLGVAYFKVLMNPEICNGRDYDLSGGEAIELRKIFEVIAENLGVKRQYINCPYPIAYIGAWGVYIISFGKLDYRERVQRLCETRVYSHEAAAKDFGYHPMSFQMGIVKEVEEYKTRKDQQKHGKG